MINQGQDLQPQALTNSKTAFHAQEESNPLPAPHNSGLVKKRVPRGLRHKLDSLLADSLLVMQLRLINVLLHIKTYHADVDLHLDNWWFILSDNTNVAATSDFIEYHLAL